jgi:DNA-binding NarL/FixJ family response regulator
VVIADGGWPIVGRAEQFRVVERVLASGGPRLLVAFGRAGFGKSTFLDETAARARRRGFAVVALSASEGPGPAHRTVAGLRTTTAGVVVTIDDVHDVDDASAVMVAEAIVRSEAICVTTCDPDRRVPEPLRGITPPVPFDITQLGPLSLTDLDALVGEALGGRVDPVLASWLRDETGGHPSFSTELMRGAVEVGTVALDALPERERAAMATVAAVEPIPLDVASAMVDEDVLVELERRGLVRLDTAHGRNELWIAAGVVRTAAQRRLGELRTRIELSSALEAADRLGVGTSAAVARWRIAVDRFDDDDALLACAAWAEAGEVRRAVAAAARVSGRTAKATVARRRLTDLLAVAAGDLGTEPSPASPDERPVEGAVVVGPYVLAPDRPTSCSLTAPGAGDMDRDDRRGALALAATAAGHLVDGALAPAVAALHLAHAAFEPSASPSTTFQIGTLGALVCAIDADLDAAVDRAWSAFGRARLAGATSSAAEAALVVASTARLRGDDDEVERWLGSATDVAVVPSPGVDDVVAALRAHGWSRERWARLLRAGVLGTWSAAVVALSTDAADVDVDDLRAAADAAATAGTPMAELAARWVLVVREPNASAVQRFRELSRPMAGGLVALLSDHVTALTSGSTTDAVRTGRALAAAGVSVGDVPSALTGRELAVARLAMRGRSSKEIAGELSLSRRTVDNVLQRIYRRLGVHRRHELRDDPRLRWMLDDEG